MSGRWYKILNLRTEFSNSIFIKICFKAYWRWTCIQNKLAFKVSSILSYFFVLSRSKKIKTFQGFYHPSPPWTPTIAPPWTRWRAYSTSRPSPAFYNIPKLNLCPKTDISKTASINACDRMYDRNWSVILCAYDRNFPLVCQSLISFTCVSDRKLLSKTTGKGRKFRSIRQGMVLNINIAI